jgi:hypothetical protein
VRALQARAGSLGTHRKCMGRGIKQHSRERGTGTGRPEGHHGVLVLLREVPEVEGIATAIPIPNPTPQRKVHSNPETGHAQPCHPEDETGAPKPAPDLTEARMVVAW